MSTDLEDFLNNLSPEDVNALNEWYAKAFNRDIDESNPLEVFEELYTECLEFWGNIPDDDKS